MVKMNKDNVKLIDVIDSWTSGDWGEEQPSDEYNKKVFCIRSADIVPIYNHSFDVATTRYISERSFNKNQLCIGDIIVEKSGGTVTCSTGRVIYVNEDIIKNNNPLVCSNFCTAFKVKKEWDTQYIYYFLRHLHKQGIFMNFEGKTSGIHNLDINTAYSAIEIPNIDLKAQEQISSLLSKIDRKITLNRAINRNLEALAKQLYDYWFVQFDFPNEEGKPYKSSGGKMVWNEKLKRKIPESWYGENICQIADILSGGTPSKKEATYWEGGTIPFFGPTDYSGNIFQISTAEKITEDGLLHCSSSLFEEDTIIITARGSIGKLVIVGTPMAMNQSCYALKAKNEEYEYLYFLTCQLIEYLKTKGSGSVFKSIITSDIENSILCIGNKKIISLFCEKIKPIFSKIKENTVEIENLTKQRDELLPLLMNSQVSVNSDLSAR